VIIAGRSTSLDSAGEGNELARLETHPRTVLRGLDETRTNLRAVEHKTARYRERSTR
jgi:hypothetical protein